MNSLINYYIVRIVSMGNTRIRKLKCGMWDSLQLSINNFIVSGIGTLPEAKIGLVKGMPKRGMGSCGLHALVLAFASSCFPIFSSAMHLVIQVSILSGFIAKDRSQHRVVRFLLLALWPLRKQPLLLHAFRSFRVRCFWSSR